MRLVHSVETPDVLSVWGYARAVLLDGKAMTVEESAVPRHPAEPGRCMVHGPGWACTGGHGACVGARMNRNDVTEKIIATKVSRGLTWSAIAERVGQSKEWTTALCLGQMTASEEQAKALGEVFGLTADEQKWLKVVPYKGSLPTAVPTDPLIYRWYEIVNVYGTTIKELIHEEFGDGIMSAIDFSMDITREPDPKGDRVNVVLSGKFLPYKTY